MAMTTVHIASAPLPTRGTAITSGDGRNTASIGRLIGLGAAVAVVGALSAAATVGLLVAAVSGTPSAVGEIEALCGTFVTITVPTMGIWLVGAIQTERTIRRATPTVEARDRAAFAELNALLARE